VTLPSNIGDFDRVSPPAKKERPPVGGLIITIVLAIALVAIIVVAVNRLSGGSLGRPASATQVAAPGVAKPAAGAATPEVSGTPADSATQQAIQQVIQQVDDAHVKAIESNDPSVMQPTATAEFYQEQISTNQDLMNNGVTDIKLVNIEWGPISVNGNTATATDWETWSTTFDDGTTEQSRDRNVYTLVLDNGTWKVQADDHPDQAAAAATPGPGVPAAP
jgi:hypothetical protein